MRRCLALAALACAVACEENAGQVKATATASAPPAPTAGVELHGAGATFPYPLYSKWIAEYHKTHPDVRIHYQSIGSGGGVKQILERAVDFGASDAPMTDAEVAKAGAKLLHIPITVGAVVVAVNIEGVDRLTLDPEAVAGIFLGDIKIWNDAHIAALNKGVKLPAQPIAVGYRSDGSGTTAVFTEYLSAVSPAWKEKVGAGKSVRFPVGTGAKGNEGVSGQVKTNPGAVGYVELAYAKQTGLTIASLENAAGKIVEPSIASITAAAATFSDKMPEDMRKNIVDPEGEAAYPISAFTYILVYQDMADPRKAKALADFLWWAAHDGQPFGADLHYAPLPAELVSRVEAQLKSITGAGKTVREE